MNKEASNTAEMKHNNETSCYSYVVINKRGQVFNCEREFESDTDFWRYLAFNYNDVSSVYIISRGKD